MAKIYNSELRFDPLIKEIIDGMGEISEGLVDLDMIETASEIKKIQKDIKKEVMTYPVN